MDQTTDAIRQDIDATRDSMTDKLEQIESKVKGTVDDLKGTVDTTVDQVKQVFDVKQQVGERPWMMFGGAVLAGYVLGSLGSDDKSSYSSSTTKYRPGESYRYYPESGSSSSSQSQGSDSSQANNASSSYSSYSASYNPSGSSSSGQSGFMGDVMDQFRDEFDALKSAAVVTLRNLMRDTLKQNVPQLAEEFERARSERDQQNTSSSQSYDPLQRSVGTTSSDAGYQTHTAATGTGATSTSGTTPRPLEVPGESGRNNSF